ncbi:vWA domain-containing protein [Hyalangium versicolor]|uniref:vWA domain-containing protein n=1 Tax=Hyalangium versicolor TaxID=2861190 RepID=UPI001CCBE98B|nr:vWA domain-containing protein [Hyalangium versicolor]
MSKRDTLWPRMTRVPLGALLCLFVATQALAADRAELAVPAEVDPCDCGPIDVVFAIDDTGSMGSSLAAFKASFPTLLAQIQASSIDYRLGLVTFKDTVTVVQNLAVGNDAAMQTSINNLTASGGNNAPEASDEALNTVIHNILSRTNQTGAFSGIWRTGARKFIVLITDNLPGGFNDAYTSNALANAQALDAFNQGIAIHAVYVPTSGTPNATVVSIMQNYANVSHGLYRQTLPNGSDLPQAVRDFLSGCRTASDVYMRDDAADLGFEPGTAPSIYMSPDIKVCNSPTSCAYPGTNPVAGTTNNHIFVTLRNHGPMRPPGPISGSLYVYYLPSGGNSTWPGSWQLIKVEHGLFLTTGEDREVRIKWDNMPGAGHYCLLARWVSAGDPMTFPELIGSNVVNNTRQNNNIAWHNIDILRVVSGGTVTTTYNVRPVPGRATDLVFKPTVAPFPGTIALTLSTKIYDLWKANGGKADGIEGAQGTTLYISPKGGALRGLLTDATLDERLTLTFLSSGATGNFPLQVYELDTREQKDVGGVLYDVTVLSPTARPFAVELGAQRTTDGLVELTWPHAAHHKAYRIYRGPSTDAAAATPIGEVDASKSTETEAVRFTDRNSKGVTYYYFVESLSGGGSVLSAAATADSSLNR